MWEHTFFKANSMLIFHKLYILAVDLFDGLPVLGGIGSTYAGTHIPLTREVSNNPDVIPSNNGMILCFITDPFSLSLLNVTDTDRITDQPTYPPRDGQREVSLPIIANH